MNVLRAWIFVGVLAALVTFPFAYGVALAFGTEAGVLYAVGATFLCAWVTIWRARRR